MHGIQQCAGTAFSSLAEQPLQSDSSLTPDSSSEPSYWSAEENSPAASSGSLARAAAGDGAGSAPQLSRSRAGSRDGTAQQLPAPAQNASPQRSSQANVPALAEPNLELPAPTVSPFQLQQHLAQQLLQRQQAGLFPQEVPQQPPQTPPWRSAPQGHEADQPSQSSPPLQPPPLSTAHQPSGSATRSVHTVVCPSQNLMRSS
jgi:hypothetical protein